MEETDEELVARAKGGEALAFASLVRRHSARAFRVATRLTGSAADGEEVVQDAFVQMFRGLDGYRGEARFSTWLFRVLTNAALMHKRKAPKTEPSTTTCRASTATDCTRTSK
jgi:RNA polymerase sigma-70 factor (ECF subfamily)